MALLKKDYDEKRNFIRMRVDTPVKMAMSDDTEIEGLCHDLSGGGFLVEINETLPIGTEAEVLISSNHGHAPILHARAVVKRIVSHPSEVSQTCMLGMEIAEVLK